jgi:type II secretory pathway pseudopilin PulG
MLLEVMLAVTVVAIGLVFVFHAFSSALRSAKASRESLQAGYLLEARVWTLETGQGPGPDEDTPLPNAQWRVESLPEEDDALEGWRTSLTWGASRNTGGLMLDTVLPREAS